MLAKPILKHPPGHTGDDGNSRANRRDLELESFQGAQTLLDLIQPVILLQFLPAKTILLIGDGANELPHFRPNGRKQRIDNNLSQSFGISQIQWGHGSHL